MSLQKSNIDTMDKYLGGQYYIPNYQRDYSWENDELSDFWDDLMLLIDTNADSSHFFGQIVVHNDEVNGKKFIIDGQQRTISSIIFLRAMQLKYIQLFNDYGLPGAHRKDSAIEMNYLAKYYDETGDYNLTLGSPEDSEFFKKYILCGKPEDCPKKNLKKSHNRLQSAFQFFSEKIESFIGSNDNESPELEPTRKLEELNSLFISFTEHFQVLFMEASELSEAFIIFETLNARGRDLETSDLLKNYIFSKSNDIAKSQNMWLTMIDKLGTADATKYVRHYWNSRHDFTRDKALYRSISQQANTKHECERLMQDLFELSPYYHDMSNPFDDCIGFDNDGIEDSLRNLKTLKASTYYPILLSLVSASVLNESDILKVLRTIETYVFRNITICNNTANSTETFFANVAKNIFDGTITSSDEIVGVINDKIVDDDEFFQAFSRWSAKPSEKEIVRYILRNVHTYIEEIEKDGDHEINLNNTEVHIEHIMPVEAEKYWGDIDEDEHAQLLWRLGNLALLGGKKNQHIKNNTFEAKREAYAESKIEPNTLLAQCETWGKKEIEDRQFMLTNYALKIWKKH